MIRGVLRDDIRDDVEWSPITFEITSWFWERPSMDEVLDTEPPGDNWQCDVDCAAVGKVEWLSDDKRFESVLCRTPDK